MVYGNIVLNEDYFTDEYIEKQVLNEMHFSKKDLQNPETIKKIEQKLTEPAAFKGFRYFINFLLVIINIAIAVLTFGIGLLPAIDKSIDIANSLKNYYPFKKDKVFKEFKNKIDELLKISEEKLKESNNDNQKEKLKVIINNCKEVQSVLEQKEKEQKDHQIQEYVEGCENAINDMIQWFNGKNNNGYDVYFKKYIFYIGLYDYKIPEKVFIDHALKSYKPCSINIYSDDADDLKMLSTKYGNLIPELKESEIGKENLINLIGHDEWQVFIGIKSKKVFECLPEKIKVTNLNKVFNDETEMIDDKYLKIADARLGYFKLSECPKQVEKKEFPIKY